MSTQFRGQRGWIKEVLTKFGDLEDQRVGRSNCDPEWPEWVSNLLIILMGISHPGSKLKNLKKWKAKDLGRFLGRQYAGEHLCVGEVPLSLEVIQEGIKFGEWAERWGRQRRPGLDLDKLGQDFEAGQKAWKPIFKGFMKETLASVCDRPYVEASAFFEAFGKAVEMKPDELLTERTMGVGDKICWTMFVMWRDIERLESIAQLHRFFEQALKSHGIIVKYKRIEKLCQRIKLKFKGRGRPPGSKIQTNPALV
jgi:hypothetical protein